MKSSNEIIEEIRKSNLQESDKAEIIRILKQKKPMASIIKDVLVYLKIGKDIFDKFYP